MRFHRHLATALCVAAFAAPLSARAQSGTENYYYPPTIKSFGKSALPIAGAGEVVVKVLVNADGTFAVQNVLRSTNHSDDATALDIAKHSTYHPAARGLAKKPVTAFYDFTIKFTGTSASNGDAGSTGSGETGALASYDALIKSGKYTDAETGLTAYLGSHPGDQAALVDLAVAQSLANDDATAATTFDKVTTIPDIYKALAAHAYIQASATAAAAKTFDVSIADAKKAVSLAPGAVASNQLGMAELSAGDNAAAVADLQKARESAASLKASDRATIDGNLVAALLADGMEDAAKPIEAEVRTLDPNNTSVQTAIANRYIKMAQDAEAAQKADDAENDWLQAAAAAPAQSGTFFGRAALIEVGKKTGSDLVKAKSEADKGLAVDPNNAVSNYVEGFILAKQGKKSDALTYLNKADASAKAGSDPGLIKGVESLIKQVQGS